MSESGLRAAQAFGYRRPQSVILRVGRVFALEDAPHDAQKEGHVPIRGLVAVELEVTSESCVRINMSFSVCVPA